MKISKTLSALALAGVLISGGMIATDANAATPVRKTAVKKTTAKKTATKKTTTAKKVSNKFTSLAPFLKACRLKGGPDYCTWGKRGITAVYDVSRYLERPGYDEHIVGAISLSGNTANPDYLLDDRDDTIALINPKTGEVEYLVEVTDGYFRYHQGQDGSAGFEGRCYKMNNYRKSGSPEDFVILVD